MPTGCEADECHLWCWQHLRSESDEVIPHHYDDQNGDDDEGGVHGSGVLSHEDDVYLAGLRLGREDRTHSTIYSIRNGQAQLGR